jgi:hypothetical protein
LRTFSLLSTMLLAQTNTTAPATPARARSSSHGSQATGHAIAAVTATIAAAAIRSARSCACRGMTVMQSTVPARFPR